MKNEPITLTNVEIQKILPHRYPFLLIDKIVDFEEGKSITGIKRNGKRTSIYRSLPG